MYKPFLNSTSDYALWTLYRSYFQGISANIELQVYNVTCRWPYVKRFEFEIYFVLNLNNDEQRSDE
jgi:hypothetical protein